MKVEESQVLSEKNKSKGNRFRESLRNSLLVGLAILAISATVALWLVIPRNPPVTITCRDGFLSDFVLQVHNMSDRSLRMYVYVANDTSSYSTGIKVLHANSTLEFGYLELNGWKLKPGDRGFVKFGKFRRKMFFDFTDDCHYKWWYGENDIPEIDVAEKVQQEEDARRIAQLREIVSSANAEAEMVYACLTNMATRTICDSPTAMAQSAWPKAKRTFIGWIKAAYSNLKKTVSLASAKRFANAQDLFNEIKTAYPNVSGLRFKWSVLAGNDGVAHTNLPVLVSANFNWRRSDPSKGCEAKNKFVLSPVDELKDDAVIMVFGDGRIVTRYSGRNGETGVFYYEFGEDESLAGAKYITPKGIVAVVDR